MKILVANFGSTSFKYRLFDMSDRDANELGKGGFERVTDYGEVVNQALADLAEQGVLRSLDDLDAIGFKTVQGGDVSGCCEADETVLDALENTMALAPAHNRPYADGIRLFAELAPDVKRAALFETAFYQWIPEYAKHYAVPESWRAIGIRRYGFHGASHKYVNERVSALMNRDDVSAAVQNLYKDGPASIEGKPFRAITCHLGGSSSITATVNGVAIGTSMGLSPQSGLPQNNRVGDLDSAAIPHAMRTLNLTLEEAERQLTKESGMLGLSNGVSVDIRDLRAAASEGNSAAANALETLAHSIRFYIGAFYAELGGLDALVFTAGIGENESGIRQLVCEPLQHLGIQLNTELNAERRPDEHRISSEESPVGVWVIPTDEEQVVAREAYRKFSSKHN